MRGVTHLVDLLCVNCQAGYYTAGRFVRNMKCSKCGGALAVVPERDREAIDADTDTASPAIDPDADTGSPAVDETPEASSVR